MVITEDALDTLQIFLIFLLTARRIRMFFSLKPSPSQGESSLKISDHWGLPFQRSQGTSKYTHTHTNSLTDWCFDREIIIGFLDKKSYQTYVLDSCLILTIKYSGRSKTSCYIQLSRIVKKCPCQFTFFIKINNVKSPLDTIKIEFPSFVSF